MGCDEELILYKSAAIWSFRRLLDGEGFVEIQTPAIRKHPGDSGRPRLQLADGRWLRESSAFALRYNLKLTPRVFEIGPMFRPDDVDATHLGEFTMLDLYASDHTLSDSADLACRLVQELYKGEVGRISIAEILLDRFGVDLWNDPNSIEGLIRSISDRFATRDYSPLRLFDRFVVEDIEPMSRDRCLLVTDFPDIPEVRAKRLPGAANVSQRFEILIDGVEVVHGYADEPDPEVFRVRAAALDNFGPEDEIMCELLADGIVPGESSGFGIGIERLCQVCLRKPSLRPFSTSWKFVE